MNDRKILITLIGVLLLGLAVPAPASADCHKAHQKAAATASIGAAAANPFGSVESSYGNYDEKCFGNDVNEVVQQIDETDAQQVKSELYTSAVEQRSQQEPTFDRIDNYGNDSRSAAWGNAEITISNAYQDGYSHATAASRANESINDYFATKQDLLAEQWNAGVTAAEHAEEVQESEEGVGEQWADVETEPIGDEQPDGAKVVGFGSTEVTLINGDTKQIRTVEVEVTDGNRQEVTEVHPWKGEHRGTKWIVCAYYENWYKECLEPVSYHVHNPNDDGSAAMIKFQEYDRVFRYEEYAAEMRSETPTYAESIYDGIETNRIDPDEVISQNTKMWKMVGEADQGSLSRSTMALGSMGLEVPELDGTGTMEVDYHGTTYHGLIASESAPDGSWSEGTYNATEMNGTQILATTDGNSFQMSGEFTINGITNESGGEVTQVNNTRIVYKTSNVSGLNRKIDNMNDYRREVEERERRIADDAEEDDGFIGGLSKTQVGVAAAVLIVLLLAATRPSPRGRY